MSDHDEESVREIFLQDCMRGEYEAEAARFDRWLTARDRAVKAEAWDECTDYVSRHFEDYLPDGWSQQADEANPYRKGADQ